MSVWRKAPAGSGDDQRYSVANSWTGSEEMYLQRGNVRTNARKRQLVIKLTAISTGDRRPILHYLS